MCRGVEPEGEALPSVETVLALAGYVDFSMQLQNIHDAVHGWVGADLVHYEQVRIVTYR